MKIGVLALQGAFREHVRHLSVLGHTAAEIRQPAHLEQVDALIIPGGESTTMGKLAVTFGLIEPLRERIAGGMPVMGTCAGAIMLASQVEGPDGRLLEQPHIGTLDIEVRRNAYGRQVDSFQAALEIPAVGAGEAAGDDPFPGIFIRAPWIDSVGVGVMVLCEHLGHICAVRQANMLATTFHPELTSDFRVHQYFLEDVCGLDS